MSSTERAYNKGDAHTSLTASSAQDSSMGGQGASHVPIAVLCDFDDTTAVENVAEVLLTGFSSNGVWEDLRRRSREKLIPFKEYQERAFLNAPATKDAMQALVKQKATLRPYFKDLWRFTQAKGIPMAIVTVGLDFYVEALLEREGLEEVPRYTVKTSFTSDGIEFEYPYPWDSSGGSSEEECRRWGNCKCSVLNRFKLGGYRILYVGDGRSDFCPASISDHVYARSQLADLCQEQGLPYTKFNDFQDVLTGLKDLLQVPPGANS